MDISIFNDLFDIGLHPIPIRWNQQTKDADMYPEHRTDVQSGNGKHDLNDVKRWLGKIRDANGIALKLHPPFFMFDFDLKNTQKKECYYHWLRAIEAADDTILKNVCIEETRSGGYHVYAKYNGVSKKVMLAASPTGKEVISVYTGGLLSFCYPTPGYTIIHNEFTDISDLTDDQFEIMVAAAQQLNEYHPKQEDYVPGEQMDYPEEYKSLGHQFDVLCPDDLWENLLNQITLYPVQDKRNTKKRGNITYYLYKREGSAAFFSAKVRFDRKRLYIFSGSFQKFPNFHTRIDENDHAWCITPTRLLYYNNNKDWVKVIELIKEYSAFFNIEVKEPVKKSITQRPDRLQFPYDIFPDAVLDYIRCQRIQHEYIAGGIIGAVACSIGNTAWLEANTGYMVKPIIYMAIVAPPGASKTPALNKAFYPLESYDKVLFAQYAERLAEYKEQLKAYEQDKKLNEKPDLPELRQIIVKDSTIEMIVKILTQNPLGCCILADELIGFLNRMNQYKAGDEVQKWLEMWSGGTILLQRITREVNRVENPFCCIIGGIQPGVLKNLSSDDNQHNGFYHRFLFLYPEPEPKADWSRVTTPDHVLRNYKYFFEHLLSFRNGEQTIYRLSHDADDLYKKWFDFKNQYYNRSTSDNVKGIIAKYQDYCLRFAIIIEVMNSYPGRGTIIERWSLEKAIRLTEYFLGNMHKALKMLAPESPLDTLLPNWKSLTEKMPDEFTTAEYIAMAEAQGIKSSAAKMFLNRSKDIFKQLSRGRWEKIV